ncbi:hypothetical protein B0J14DRAFT_609487 [Halenospora varia]|nr:hypothetical protein B0J14DRAFT_609487 [Halenospora varia]
MATRGTEQKAAKPLPPMIFTTPGLEPDTLLQVFEQPFHASSMSLKIHSAFFRKFLDSPDKALAPQTLGFKYAWTSLVDADGSWSLVCDPTKILGQSIQSTYKLKINKEKEVAAFKALMSALHSVPFDIKTMEEITVITKMADYYCALPILSNALYRSCLRNTVLNDGIRQTPCAALETAFKLRNEALFRDCVIHAINPWGSPVFRRYSFQDKKLSLCLRLAYGRLCEKVTKTDQEIRTHLHLYCNGPRVRLNFYKAVETIPNLGLPGYYRRLYETSDIEVDPQFKDAIGPLLENKLVFGGGDTRDAAAGRSGIYRDHFLCIEVADEDLPWDVNERDW